MGISEQSGAVKSRAWERERRIHKSNDRIGWREQMEQRAGRYEVSGWRRGWRSTGKRWRAGGKMDCERLKRERNDTRLSG